MLFEETYRKTEGKAALLIVRYLCRVVCSEFVRSRKAILGV